MNITVVSTFNHSAYSEKSDTYLRRKCLPLSFKIYTSNKFYLYFVFPQLQTSSAKVHRTRANLHHHAFAR